MTYKDVILDSIDGIGTTRVTPIGGNPDQYDPQLIPSRSDINRYTERSASNYDFAQRKEQSRKLLDKLIRSMVLDRFRVEFAHLTSRDRNKNASAYKLFYTWVNESEELEI